MLKINDYVNDSEGTSPFPFIFIMQNGSETNLGRKLSGLYRVIRRGYIHAPEIIRMRFFMRSEDFVIVN